MLFFAQRKQKETNLFNNLFLYSIIWLYKNIADICLCTYAKVMSSCVQLANIYEFLSKLQTLEV